MKEKTSPMSENRTPLNGIMVAVVTPLTDDGNHIDVDTLHRHIERLITAGVRGLVPCGSTGEFTVLSLAERKQVTEECIKAAQGRVPVIVSTGALSTAEGVELSRHAVEAGAAALMVVPPFYDAPSIEELHRLLRTVHEASGLPIVYYNIPGATGLNLTVEQIVDLAQVQGVQYLKDTSGDAVALGELLTARSESITAFNGWDTLTFFALASGATGAVWGAANIIPELSVQLWDAIAVRGDLAEGRRLWAKIWPICHFLESHNYAAAVKTAMSVAGYPAGPVREPFTLLGREARDEIEQLLTAAEVI